jgi:hypothetical protein
MHRLPLQYLLASRGIHGHYDTAEFEADLKTLKATRPAVIVVSHSFPKYYLRQTFP